MSYEIKQDKICFKIVIFSLMHELETVIAVT